MDTGIYFELYRILNYPNVKLTRFHCSLIAYQISVTTLHIVLYHNNRKTYNALETQQVMKAPNQNTYITTVRHASPATDNRAPPPTSAPKILW
jgi:hypothetical protein